MIAYHTVFLFYRVVFACIRWILVYFTVLFIENLQPKYPPPPMPYQHGNVKVPRLGLSCWASILLHLSLALRLCQILGVTLAKLRLAGGPRAARINVSQRSASSSSSLPMMRPADFDWQAVWYHPRRPATRSLVKQRVSVDRRTLISACDKIVGSRDQSVRSFIVVCSSLLSTQARRLHC